MKRKLTYLLLLIFIIVSNSSNATVSPERARQIAHQKNIKVKIILDTPEENAYATYDGNILITKPLLDNKALTEEELLWVIFHEQSHVYFNHVKEATKLLDSLKTYIDTSKKDVYLNELTLKSMSESFALVYIAFVRKNELEADDRSFLLMKRNGYSKTVCNIFKDVFSGYSDERSPYSTHPTAADRYNKCVEVLGQ